MHVVTTVMWIVCLTGVAFAQNANTASMPREIGNRANGFDYQPTPQEVLGPEIAAGVRPSAGTQEAENRILTNLDRHLLRSEGLKAANAPNFQARQ